MALLVPAVAAHVADNGINQFVLYLFVCYLPLQILSDYLSNLSF